MPNQKKPTPPLNPTDFIYPPARAVTVALTEFERRINSTKNLTWGVPEIDARMNPPVGGDLIMILGRPGMGKTLSLISRAKRVDALLRQNWSGTGNRPVVVYATWETMVEEFVGLFSAPQTGVTLEMIGRGQVNLNALENALIHVLGSHIVVFGRSMDNIESPDPPTLVDLDAALYALREAGLEVVEILIDYLQRIPPMFKLNGFGDTMEVVKENLNFAKNMGQRYGASVWMGAQSKRDVDDYGGLKFPLLDDGQWSSVIEQTADKAFSLTMPGKYMKIGKQFAVNGWMYEVTPTTLGIKMLKQRFGKHDENDVWIMDLDPVNMEITLQPTVGEDVPDLPDSDSPF